MKSPRPRNQSPATFDDYSSALFWAQELIATNHASLPDYDGAADDARCSPVTAMVAELLDELNLTHYCFRYHEGPIKATIALEPDVRVRRAHAWILHPEGTVLEHGRMTRCDNGEWLYRIKKATTLCQPTVLAHTIVIGPGLEPREGDAA